MNLLNFSLAELESMIIKGGFPKFRARQLYDAMIQGKTLGEVGNIPAVVKEFYAEAYPKLSILAVKEGSSNTKKYIFKTRDDNVVEGVFLPYKHGNTFCISTQVGCRMGCTFCASGESGLIRNLEAGEMLGAVCLISKDNQKEDKRAVTNVVLMGSGEPLDNYDNVVKFISLLCAKEGLGVSKRNISLSTCGLVKKIYELADSGLGVNLTISLHAPSDVLRRKLMKVANAYSIEEIIAAAKYYFEKTGRRIIFEYVLIHEINDSPQCGIELAGILRGLACHVNLIPLNSTGACGLKGTDRKKAYAFMDRLTALKISATVRRTMGEDIGGACGQLRTKFVGDNNLVCSNKKDT